jgi:hypothetical protein
MTKGHEVLSMLIPTGGWVIYGNEFDSIIYDEGVQPITKAEFDAGFAQFDEWKIEQEEAKATTRQALLERLGITADEAALLLG